MDKISDQDLKTINAFLKLFGRLIPAAQLNKTEFQLVSDYVDFICRAEEEKKLREHPKLTINEKQRDALRRYGWKDISDDTDKLLEKMDSAASLLRAYTDTKRYNRAQKSAVVDLDDIIHILYFNR